MEPSEAALPAAQRARATGQEPRREGRVHDREAELPAVRHDDAPARRLDHQGAARQARAGRGALALGQRPAAHGPAHAVAAVPRARVRRARERVRAALRRRLRGRDETHPRVAGP